MLCALLSTTTPGCVPVPRGNDLLDMRFMTSDELRTYSERVFRRHNRATTRLMLAQPDDDITEAEYRQIRKAESRMNEACASLNEVASARAGGRDVGRKLENRVRVTVRACAESTRRLENLLDRHGIGSQSPYMPGTDSPTAATGFGGMPSPHPGDEDESVGLPA